MRINPHRKINLCPFLLQGLAKRLLNEGVRGLVVCGTTGEAAAMSKDDQLEVLDAALEVAHPNQVIMGLSRNVPPQPGR